MDISEGEIHESRSINAYGSLVAGELSGEDENIDVTGENKIDDKIWNSQLSWHYMYKSDQARREGGCDGCARTPPPPPADCWGPLFC